MPINRIRLDDVDVRNLSTTTSLLNTALGDLQEKVEINRVNTNATVTKLQNDLLLIQNELSTKAPIADPNFTGVVRAAGGFFTTEVVENVIVSATSLSGTVNIDFSDNATYFYTANAAGNWTFNFRASAILALNSYLQTGQLCTVTVLVTNGSTPFRATGFQIDGTNITVRWADAVAPASGNANSIDIYTFTIVKTANATYSVFGSLARFA